MAKSKPLMSPRGKMIWPHISGKPDYKFDADGLWHVKLECDLEESQPLIEKIDAAIKEQFEKSKKEYAGKKDSAKKPIRVKLCEDKPYVVNEEESICVFNFKMKFKVTPKEGEPFTQQPALFGPDGRTPLDSKVRVGGGSEGKCAFDINPFFTVKLGAGASLRLKAAQVIVLKKFGADGEYYGFGNEGEGDGTTDTDTDEFSDETGADDESRPMDDDDAAEAGGSEDDDF